MKYTNILTVVFCILLILFCFSCQKESSFGNQDKSAFFIKLYGGIENQFGFDIQQKHDGGYIIVGATTSFKDTLNNANQEDISEEIWNAYLISTDNEGNEKWSWTYEKLTEDEPDFFLIQGVRVLIQPDSTYSVIANYELNEDDNKIAVFKVDQLGETISETILNKEASELDYAASMQFTEDGGLIIVGTTKANDEKNTNSDIRLIKLNSNGEIEWQKTYGTESKHEYGVDIHLLENEYVILSLVSDIGTPTTNTTALSVIKVTNTGQEILQKEYGQIDRVDLTDICKPSITNTIDGDILLSFAKNNNLELLELNKDLSEKKQTTIQVEGTFSACDAKTLSDGYALLGNKGNSGKRDAYFIRTDSEGTVLFDKTHGGNEDDLSSQIIPTQNGGFAIIGTSDFSVNTMISLVKTNNEGELAPLD